MEFREFEQKIEFNLYLHPYNGSKKELSINRTEGKKKRY